MTKLANDATNKTEDATEEPEAVRICAMPYDGDQRHRFFFFSSVDEYEAKSGALYQAHQVEEFELEIVDGSDTAIALNTAYPVDQANLASWLRGLELLEAEPDERQALYLWLMESQWATDPISAMEVGKGWAVWQGTVGDFAEETAYEGGELDSHPYSAYIDWEQVGRDAVINGELFEGRTVTGRPCVFVQC